MIVIALITAFVLWFLYVSFIRTYLVLLRLKMQLGDEAVICYRALGGQPFQFGDSFAKYGDSFEYLRQIVQQNPKVKVILSNFFTSPLLVFCDSSYAKQMYLDHEQYKKYNQFEHHQLTSRGLIFAHGKTWKRQRTMLSDFFTFDELKQRYPMMNQVCRDKLSNLRESNNIIDLLESITGDIVIRSFLGDISTPIINGKPAYRELMDLFNDQGQLCQTLVFFIKSKILGQKTWTIMPTRVEKDIDNRIQLFRQFVQLQIDKKLKNQQKDKAHKDLLDVQLEHYLVEGQKELDQDEIIQQFITVFVAGTDTVALTIVAVLFYLNQNPQDYIELTDEIQEVVGDSNVETAHLPRLVKLQAYINETLRLRNPLPVAVYRDVQQDHNLLNIKMKQGWKVLIANFLPDLKEVHFDNPLQFNYKRWLSKEPIQQNNGFVNVPFSAGPRNCIGQQTAQSEMKIILCHILRSFNIKCQPDLQWRLKFLYQIDDVNGVQIIRKQ